MSRHLPTLCVTAALAVVLSEAAHSQAQPSTNLPPVAVSPPDEPKRAKPAQARDALTARRTATRSRQAPAATPAVSAASGTGKPGSLTVPTTAQATADIERIPGGVEVVPDTAFKNGPANTIKDVLGWVPGVLIQTRWGPDGRISIRGSGLTRNYGNRGINVYTDGIPINTSDGLFDLFEIDPSAYRYVEVYKGANGLRYGANALGGAINFVTPTGRDAPAFDARVDAGSFGFLRGQAATAGVSGPYDWFVNGSAQREDGYRFHNQSDVERLNANFGYQFSPDAETRFYINANSWRARLPGELTKTQALNTPKMANPDFVFQDQQRNIDSVRIANKTTVRFDTTTVDFGVFTHQRHVDHPIFRYLDYYVSDYGGFVRATDERMIGGFRNRLIVGGNVIDGTFDYQEYDNIGNATKGILRRNEFWKSQNHSIYGENSFYVLPNLALIAGGQFLHAARDQQDRLLTNGDQSGRRTWDIPLPKVGVLWDVSPVWQVFGNISRSAEVPSYDANTFTTAITSNVDAQTATTYEMGTRGRTTDLTWDISLYRANLSKELQCLMTSPFSLCTVVNANRTIHQGVEAGLGVAFVKSAFAQDDRFWFNLAYTYGDFRFDNDAKWGNNRLPGAPPHYLRAEIVYKHPSGFYAGPNVEWMPQAFFADNANSLTVDPYALLNFKVGYDRGTGWSGYLEGRNLFDRRYISTTVTAEVATAASALFNPGMGRAVYGGLRYRM